MGTPYIAGWDEAIDYMKLQESILTPIGPSKENRQKRLKWDSVSLRGENVLECVANLSPSGDFLASPNVPGLMALLAV